MQFWARCEKGMKSRFWVGMRTGLGGRSAVWARGRPDVWRQAILPRAIAQSVAVVSLVTISGGLALFLGYIGVYGFSPWGVGSFTRTVGQVFEPIVTMLLGLKTALFALAVGTIPAVVRYTALVDGQQASSATLPGRQRLFIVLLAIEILSLIAAFF